MIWFISRRDTKFRGTLTHVLLMCFTKIMCARFANNDLRTHPSDFYACKNNFNQWYSSFFWQLEDKQTVFEENRTCCQKLYSESCTNDQQFKHCLCLKKFISTKTKWLLVPEHTGGIPSQYPPNWQVRSKSPASYW